MAQDTTTADEEGGLSRLEETDGGQTQRPDKRGFKLSQFIKVQLYLPIKDIVLVDEQKLKYMKQGIDISRSRLVSEAIRLLAQSASEGKFELRG